LCFLGHHSNRGERLSLRRTRPHTINSPLSRPGSFTPTAAQAATAAVLCSQPIASSISRGLRPYSEARSSIDSRALNLEATTAVEMPVPAITGFPKPTAGLIWISLGSFCVLSMTNGYSLKRPLGSLAHLGKTRVCALTLGLEHPLGHCPP
jgi:hypothetical protein